MKGNPSLIEDSGCFPDKAFPYWLCLGRAAIRGSAKYGLGAYTLRLYT